MISRNSLGGVALASILTLLVASWLVGKEKDDGKAKENTQFAALKKLTGEWTGIAHHADSQPSEARVNYKITSSGSALMETLFCQSDHEMITMYYCHGDDLLLTHYCAAGNQPRMKAVKSDNAKKLDFKFLDGTNMDPAKDMHMHEVTIEFVDADHIKSEWKLYMDGKPAGSAQFDLKRKK